MFVKMLEILVFMRFLKLFDCDTTVTVEDFECGRTYDPTDGELTLFYHGETLHSCTFYLKTQHAGKKVCAKLEKMELSSCATTIEFYSLEYRKSTRSNKRNTYQMFTCTTERMAEYCQPLVTELNVDFTHDGPNTSDEVRIRITYVDDLTVTRTFTSDTYLAIVLPFVLVSVLFILVTVVFIVRKRRKGKRQSSKLEPQVGVFTTFS